MWTVSKNAKAKAQNLQISEKYPNWISLFHSTLNYCWNKGLLNKAILFSAAWACYDLKQTYLNKNTPNKGNILDDEALIDTLSDSKVTSVKIEEQVKQQEITSQQIQETRMM